MLLSRVQNYYYWDTSAVTRGCIKLSRVTKSVWYRSVWIESIVGCSRPLGVSVCAVLPDPCPLPPGASCITVYLVAKSLPRC